MAEMGIVFPLLPDSRPALEAFVNALRGARRADFAASQVSVVEENWFVQATPAGDLLIVYLKAAAPAEVFANLAVSQAPFDVWFREQAKLITGLDLTQLPPTLPEHVFHWTREETI